jgi:pimeloyl-ACP methyl ester carboxylesterase
VQDAVDYLKTRSDVIDTKKIGLIGHSEGGLIAPMVAAKNQDVAFIVLLAGPGVDGGEVLLTQVKRAAELAGDDKKDIAFNAEISKVAFDMIRQQQDLDKLAQNLTEYLKKVRKENHNNVTKSLTDEKLAAQVKSLSSPWLTYFIRTNTADFLQKISCPVLAINGSLDFQVIADVNLPAINKALQNAHNKDTTVKKLTGLNHLFQQANTGAASEYAKIEQTVSPKALELVSQWINQRFGE